MNNLRGTRVYLCGPVEIDPKAADWRDEITPLLQDMGIQVLNPLKKPQWMPQIDGAEQAKMKEYFQEYGNKDVMEIIMPSSLTEINMKIRSYCLALVRMSDFIILNLTRKVFTVGSFEEITMARDKPIFLITSEAMPSMWLADQLNLYSRDNYNLYVHTGINSCIKTLFEITLGKHQLDPFKWIFITNNQGK